MTAERALITMEGRALVFDDFDVDGTPLRLAFAGGDRPSLHVASVLGQDVIRRAKQLVA